MMQTIIENQHAIVDLATGQSLTVIADSIGAALVFRLADQPGGEPSLGAWSVANAATVIGPYAHPTRFDINCTTNAVSYGVSSIDGSTSIPAGGASGQMLVKSSSADFDVSWGEPPQIKYLLAGYNRVHMAADDDLLTLDPLNLPNGATQDDANARANELQASAIEHMADVGTFTVDGAHLAADTANSATLAAVDPATDLPSCIVLVEALLVYLNDHSDQAGVHFNDDAAGAADTMTQGTPTTLAHCITDLNDLRAAFQRHNDRASV